MKAMVSDRMPNRVTGNLRKKTMLNGNNQLYRYTHFYTAANVHSAIKQFLQIIHTSLAIEILS